MVSTDGEGDILRSCTRPIPALHKPWPKVRAGRLPVPWLVVKAVRRKISPKSAESAMLPTVLGLKKPVGLSDIVCCGEKNADPSGTGFVSQSLGSDCMCLIWQPIPNDVRSRGNVKKVVW